MGTDLQTFAGDTCPFDLQCVQANGSPFDLTGSTLYATVKKNETDPDAAALWAGSSPGDGIAITNATAGFATATMPSSATEGLTAQILLWYWVRLVDTFGNKTTVRAGRILVKLTAPEL